jgi:hypothetical protein
MKKNYYQAKKLAKAVINELQVLRKLLSEKEIVELRNTHFWFNDSCGCLYGTLFENAYSCNSIDFKRENKLTYEPLKIDLFFIKKVGLSKGTISTALELAFMNADNDLTNAIIQRALDTTPEWDKIEQDIYKIILTIYHEY